MTNAPVQSPRGVGRRLFTTALEALSKDKTTLLAPIIGMVLNLVVLAALGIGWLLLIPVADSQLHNAQQIINVSLGVIGAIAFGVIHVNTQAIVMVMADAQYEGKKIGFGEALGITGKKTVQLFSFGAMEATVGLIMRAARENFGFIGKIISGLIGLAWGIGTYFTIPYILFADLGPIASIKKSVELLRSKWGEALRVNVWAGALFILGWLLTFAMLIFGFVNLVIGTQGFTQKLDSVAYMDIALIAVSAVIMFVLLLVQATVMSFVRVALFRYATGKSIPGFDAQLLDSAVITKANTGKLRGLLS